MTITQEMEKIDIESAEYFESITTNWQKVLDSAYARVEKPFEPGEGWKRLQTLFHGDEPGMTEKEKQSIAWTHFNYQVENGGIEQYFGNDFGDELPYVLDVLFEIRRGGNQTVALIFDLIQQMAQQAFCPEYVFNDEYCKSQFRKYDFDKAVNDNAVNYDDDEDFEVEYPYFTLEDGTEFDDIYYANKIELGKQLDKYFAQPCNN